MATTVRGITSAQVERTLRTIFKRCVQCPPDTPTCPTCSDGEVCSLFPQNCHSCAHMTCVRNPSPPPPSSGPNVGAIAGGVVGGVAFIILVVFCVYWFWIKKRREEQDAELEEEWQNDEIASQKRSTRFTAADAASTRTRGSLANSILSRASNIIQIAYIPGVTNRNGSGRNSMHAPVPPIPAAHRNGGQPPKSPLSNEGDALFFRPGDLRDSTWSGSSSMVSGNRDTRYTNNRDTRYTMASISPSLMRDSVASDTVFWDDATAQPMPAQTASSGAARMVSVKSGRSSDTPDSDTGSGTPDEGRVKMLQVMMPGQGSGGLSPNPSVKSSSSSTFAKPKQVTVGSKGRFPVRQGSDASTAASSRHTPAVSSPLAEEENPAEEPSAADPARRSLIKNMDFATPPAVQPVESPFFDASEAPPPGSSSPRSSSPKLNPYASMASTVSTSHTSPAKRGSRSMNRLSAVVEEAKRNSQDTTNADDESKRDPSPFSDEHATE